MIIETIGIIAGISTINDKLKLTHRVGQRVRLISLYDSQYVTLGEVKTLNNKLEVY